MPERTPIPYPNLRVRALIVSGGHLLLARLHTRPVVFFPGGRVESDESLVDASAREVKEECGAIADRIEYLGAVENIWSENGRRIHHFFLVESAALGPSATPHCQDQRVELYWVPFGRAKHEPIKPESVKRLLCGWLDGQRNVWWAYESEA